MGKHFFDYEDGDFAHTISDNMAIDSDGDMLMRMGDNMAMDIDTGELHFISGWSDDEDDDWKAIMAAENYSLPPLFLNIYDFFVYYFHGGVADGIHFTHPQHLVGCL